MCAEIVPMCGDFYPHASGGAERRDGQPGGPLGEGRKRRQFATANAEQRQ
jgi:hypothetical protein